MSDGIASSCLGDVLMSWWCHHILMLGSRCKILLVQVPRELKRHLFSIEEKILEAQAWEKGSSLYPLLIAACSKSSASSSPADKDTPMEDSPRDNSPKVGSDFIWGHS